MKKLIVTIIFLFTFFIFVEPAFAEVDYVIKDVQIDAYLMESGDVAVKERFTYDFEGEFNGITRTIIPKKGTAIEDFVASEAGSPLKVEKEDSEYKIYRKGNEETVTIELGYTIMNGVEVYQDVAQFYWPFFDSSNESVYENMTIYVHPPARAVQVTAYGYDEAYDTAEVTADGGAVFSLGYVEDGKNGDIQVVYDETLFGAAPLTSEKMMKDSILEQIADNEAKLAAFQDRKAWLNRIAPYIVGGFGLFLVLLLFVSIRQKMELKHDVQRRIKEELTIPKLNMSIPATIYYTNSFTPKDQLLTSSLLELVRKGYVRTKNQETFLLVDRYTEYDHEYMLINFLFDTIGNGKTFRFKELQTFLEDESNHNDYNEHVQAWIYAIKQEVKSKELTKAKKGFRWTVALLSLLLVPLAVFFGIHELFMWMAVSIILFLGLLAFSIFYNPKTLEGAKIWEEWKQFNKNFDRIPPNQLEKWSTDEQIIAVNYAYGMNDKGIKIWNNPIFTSNKSMDSSNVMMYLLLASTANLHFSEADAVTAATTNSSSTTTVGTGTGVGGGGGGSGAF
ncbi:DUF2207 domain-containing protein [Ornithinibacillus massiliensis]|uniref:DUF2207 domain-containing protein n=1 Tax=Ornithinibacillus massiliensis TaxID=1944633 RepID=A0ABS5MAK5_9BACI|nr:DUF2207 domain-containing protein [Ornithinibacillus massiliensis]MBS3679349.1 DUF2207 domain-containing protein [Ornithinibacillus massiliensis]